LAWAGVVSKVNRLEAELQGSIAELRRYCGDRCVLPQPGDLKALLGSTATVEMESAAALEVSPLWRVKDLRAAVDRSDAEVMEKTAWGRPEAEVEWEHVPGLDGLSSFNAFGVRLRFPLPTGSAGSKTREAAAARKIEAEADLRIGRALLETRLAGALASARSAERTLDQLETVVEKMDDAEFSLAEQFRLGAISYLVYIHGIARFDDIWLEVLEARSALLRQRLVLAVITADARYFPIPELQPTPDTPTEENPS